VAFREELCPPVFCRVDHFRLAQVFRNLLENSLAACVGPVEIVVRCTAENLGGQQYLRVAVRDNGPGLSVEMAEKVFQPFYTTKLHGTGLGLSIARRIVEAHGGRITAGAAEPRGAEIVLMIPVEGP
jgi:signal transduction histidine kinase